ncbi:prephenate dehydrogenase [Virgibacillus sp. 179-BFC.A HS]|uniref:Prephenate dehydrogenase n=1 Tax=Tigheibacillus jepli TaxID=3035914 RepID=A0ABU5CHC0_9BACI|nr:prephenate dehydrogenase [Virgibacillus sp. 179-BFC.A HS]MDY0405705.1 prephenate dehydrogenase [Virgibacillus sp. 179-BFC.A HS]
MTTNILIAGLGLIGGSIAKALVHQQDNYITGFDIDERTLRFAKEQHIIHEYDTDFEQLATKADIIMLAAPISITLSLLNKLDHYHFEKDVIITDVSSVKGVIMDTAKQLTNKRIAFIGGHPMAGSHKIGIHAAKEHLFENAIYVLSPAYNANDAIINRLKQTLLPLKSNFIILQPDEHDEMTAVVSHFPHLIASALVHQARSWEETHSYLPKLAAGGFRDITRIASSNPALWQDIFHHNQSKMAHLLKDWIKEMEYLYSLLIENDKNAMLAYLQQAKIYRDGLQVQHGALPSFYDLFVDIRDQPGAIAAVIQILADDGISISNIQILEIREGITGALRITVTTESAQQRAISILRKNGYEISLAA